MAESGNALNVAIVGCGNIATRYAEQIQCYAHVNLLGFSDILEDKARQFVKQYGGKLYPRLDDVLSDTRVDAVVNLTIHHAHAEVITRCLEGGKHVHTEKPFAMTYRDASRLVQLAEGKHLRLSSAPITYMGEAQQTAWKVIRDGGLGKIRLVYSEINHGRIETWHPNPEAFYDVGVLWDVGPYPLTLLTTFFGRISRVRAFGRVIHPDRKTEEGRSFRIEVPDCVFATIEMEEGPLVRLSANFYAKGSKQGGSMEIHGDGGRLFLGDFQGFSAPVEYARFGEDYQSVPYLKEPYDGIEFARGIEDLADAILNDRPHRASAKRAAHVVEVIESINRSIESGEVIEITSCFSPPSPMEWSG